MRIKFETIHVTPTYKRTSNERKDGGPICANSFSIGIPVKAKKNKIIIDEQAEY
ncbi:MAG: hypothetical protein ABI358_10000 [Ginsengibacter sp.]